MAEIASSGSSSPIVFDPTAPDYIANPYPMLQLIREADPLHRSKMGWLVTRYEHVSAVLRSGVFGGPPFPLSNGGRSTVLGRCSNMHRAE